MNDFATVQAWLRNTYNIGVSAEWLTACLEWIQQENQGHMLSPNDLIAQVFEQWLMSDLAEIGEPVLPQNVTSAERHELISNYPLQLISVVDVGFPLYGQKQRLTGRNNPNDDVSADKPFQPAWEPKPTRMLILQLTDGHTQVQAMEYQQIKDLHTVLPGGLKLLVSGTVLCRRGMIMLTPDCVQVLGGEVEALNEQNTPLANLEQAMNRNRQDEGKHAKTEFSGKFISRGAKKKLDNMQNSHIKKSAMPYSKQEAKVVRCSYPPGTSNKVEVKQEITTNIRTTNSSLTAVRIVSSGNFGQAQDSMKQEVLPSSSLPGRSKEQIQSAMKKATSVTVQNTPCNKEQMNMKISASSEGHDGMNYDDLLEDDMDAEELEALDSLIEAEEDESKKDDCNVFTHNGFKTKQQDKKSCSWSSSYLQEQRGKLDGDENHERFLSSKNAFPGKIESMPTNPLHQPTTETQYTEECDLDFFDDDFEVDKIVDPTLPDNVPFRKDCETSRTCSSPLSAGQISSNRDSLQRPVWSTSNFPASSRDNTGHLNYENVSSHSSPLIQNAFGHSNNETSPCISFQGGWTSDLPHTLQPTSVHLKTDVSKVPGKKLPLFKTKSTPGPASQKQSRCNSRQSKKQCKLSDIFHVNTAAKKAKGGISPKQDFIRPCDAQDFPLSLNPAERNTSTANLEPRSWSSSAHILITTDMSEDSSVNDVVMEDISPLSNPHPSIQKEEQQHESGQQKDLPKAIIHPFRTADSCEYDENAPYTYLSQMAGMEPPAIVKVKAYISTLTDKLSSGGGSGWSLSCRINDGTACVDVELADRVLTQLIGFSAADSVVMRERMKADPQIKDVLMEGLSQCQQKLINISCLMEVSIVSATAKPVVQKLIPLSGQHLHQLLMRVERQLTAQLITLGD